MYTAKAGVDRLVPRPYSYACAGALMNFAIIIFAVEVKTVNIMRRENLALYGMRVCMCVYVCMHVRVLVCACASMFVHACMCVCVI